jgi:TPR repeat protein
MNDLEIHKALLSMHDREYLFSLSYLDQAGFALPEDGQEAIEWCRSAADSGSPEAQFVLAKLIGAGLFTARNKQKALSYCVRAAESGFGPAITMLAGFHDSGWAGLTPDPNEAVRLFRIAAARDDPGALAALGGMSIAGRGLTTDRNQGLEYFRRAAEQSDKLSQFFLGTQLVNDLDPALEAEGLKWIKLAAAQRVSSAHRQLAKFFAEGLHGLPVDSERAQFHTAEAHRLEQELRS